MSEMHFFAYFKSVDALLLVGTNRASIYLRNLHLWQQSATPFPLHTPDMSITRTIT